jgi:hypothetical protein
MVCYDGFLQDFHLLLVIIIIDRTFQWEGRFEYLGAQVNGLNAYEFEEVKPHPLRLGALNQWHGLYFTHLKRFLNLENVNSTAV